MKDSERIKRMQKYEVTIHPNGLVIFNKRFHHNPFMISTTGITYFKTYWDDKEKKLIIDFAVEGTEGFDTTECFKLSGTDLKLGMKPILKAYSDKLIPAEGHVVKFREGKDLTVHEDTSHIELSVNYKKSELSRFTRPNLKLKKEGKKDMFNLAEYKPDNSKKDSTTYYSLTYNALRFLDSASEKAFELLDQVFDDDDEEIENLKFLFSETKTSLLASMDIS